MTKINAADCFECTRDRVCRAHQIEQLRADVAAWLAAGNRPVEVPVGVSGMRFGEGMAGAMRRSVAQEATA